MTMKQYRTERLLDQRREEGLDPLTGRRETITMYHLLPHEWLFRRVADVSTDMLRTLRAQCAVEGVSMSAATAHAIIGNILQGLSEMGRRP